jgi:uncharacterized membrane protein
MHEASNRPRRRDAAFRMLCARSFWRGVLVPFRFLLAAIAVTLAVAGWLWVLMRSVEGW